MAKTFFAFKESDYSSPSLQSSAIGPCSESVKFSAYLLMLLCKIHFNITLAITLGLSNGFVLEGFATRFLHVPCFSRPHACYMFAHPIFLHLFTLTVRGSDNRGRIKSDCSNFVNMGSNPVWSIFFLCCFPL
jgi:hypothetical protein